MGYPIRINICHWERSNAENPDTESVVSKMEITAAYGKGFTARSILKLLATDSKIQSGQRQISRYVSDISVFYIRVENSSYVFVLFPRLPTPRLSRYGSCLPCFRFRGRSYGRGSEYKQDFRTKKSAATYILRLIYLSEPEGPRSWLFSDPLP